MKTANTNNLKAEYKAQITPGNVNFIVESGGTTAEDERITNVRQYIEDSFKRLFGDIFNIIEIATYEPKTAKVKDLIGARLQESRISILEKIDTLYPEDVQATLPPVGTGNLPE